jgi:hypothetical protein
MDNVQKLNVCTFNTVEYIGEYMAKKVVDLDIYSPIHLHVAVLN